jgi:hypothetical protein
VLREFPKVLQKRMEDVVDAFLYLGPQDLRLSEKLPADIAWDVNYRTELGKGGAMFGFPEAATETAKEFDQDRERRGEPAFCHSQATGPQGPGSRTL